MTKSRKFADLAGLRQQQDSASKKQEAPPAPPPASSESVDYNALSAKSVKNEEEIWQSECEEVIRECSRISKIVKREYDDDLTFHCEVLQADKTLTERRIIELASCEDLESKFKAADDVVNFVARKMAWMEDHIDPTHFKDERKKIHEAQEYLTSHILMSGKNAGGSSDDILFKQLLWRDAVKIAKQEFWEGVSESQMATIKLIPPTEHDLRSCEDLHRIFCFSCQEEEKLFDDRFADVLFGLSDDLHFEPQLRDSLANSIDIFRTAFLKEESKEYEQCDALRHRMYAMRAPDKKDVMLLRPFYDNKDNGGVVMFSSENRAEKTSKKGGAAKQKEAIYVPIIGLPNRSDLKFCIKAGIAAPDSRRSLENRPFIDTALIYVFDPTYFKDEIYHPLPMSDDGMQEYLQRRPKIEIKTNAKSDKFVDQAYVQACWEKMNLKVVSFGAEETKRRFYCISLGGKEPRSFCAEGGLDGKFSEIKNVTVPFVSRRLDRVSESVAAAREEVEVVVQDQKDVQPPAIPLRQEEVDSEPSTSSLRPSSAGNFFSIVPGRGK